MKNENPKVNKVFVRIVGVAAAVAIIFLGVTGIRPTTFLGSLDHQNVSAPASLKIAPATIVQAKGRAFSADVVLTPGKGAPKDLRITIDYDKDLMQPLYVDTDPAGFILGSSSTTIENGKIRIRGTFANGASGVVDSGIETGKEKVLAHIYFQAKQNIGTSRLSLEHADAGSSLTAYDEAGNILGVTEDAKVTVTIQ